MWTNYYAWCISLSLLQARPLCPKVTIAYTGAPSYITSSLLQNAGGLTVSNVSQYADTNGEAAAVFQTLLPPSNTNFATQTQLAAGTNGFLLSLLSYAPLAMTNTDNTVYSSNPSHYLTSSATNGITRLGSNVVSSIINGSNLIVSSSQTSTGIIYTVMTNYSGGLTYITNINAVTLAQWGAFTTNAYSWGNYLAPTNDWTNAIIYTNGLISVATAAATFQPAGSYLTSSSNLNYAKFTNAPTIPSTNGLVTSNIFNGFATTAWVLLQNYLTPSLVSYYAPTSFVLSSVAPYPTTTTLNSSSNVLQSGITANSNSIALHWGTNQALVASILVNSNMTATFITNGGVITVTLGSTTNLYASSSAGLQPAAANLTNWSGVPTNQILLTPSLVTTLVAGNNTTVTYTTNSGGVQATVNAYYQYNSPVQVASGYIGRIVGFPYQSPFYLVASQYGGAISWNALPAVPNNFKIYNASGGYLVYCKSNGVVTLDSTGLTNVTFSATGCSGTGTNYTSPSQNVNIIAICQ